MKLARKGNATFSAVNRWIWTRLTWHQVNIYVPNHPKKPGIQRILLNLIRGSGGSSVTIDLTALTEPELLAWRETVLLATEVALPIVRELDRAAQEESDEGDDSNNRLYRGLPTVVVRQRTLREYDERILGRSKDVLPGAVFNVMPGKPVPADGSGMDEDLEGEGGSQDDPAQSNDNEGDRQVPGD